MKLNPGDFVKRCSTIGKFLFKFNCKDEDQEYYRVKSIKGDIIDFCVIEENYGPKLRLLDIADEYVHVGLEIISGSTLGVISKIEPSDHGIIVTFTWTDLKRTWDTRYHKTACSGVFVR